MITSFNNFLTEAVWDKTGLLKGKNLVYHCTSQKVAQKILIEDSLKSFRTTDEISDKLTNSPFLQKIPQLSFTRNFSLFYSGNCQFILDKNLLKQKYPLYQLDHPISPKPFTQSEEVLPLKELYPLSKYNIGFIWARFDPLWVIKIYEKRGIYYSEQEALKKIKTDFYKINESYTLEEFKSDAIKVFDLCNYPFYYYDFKKLDKITKEDFLIKLDEIISELSDL